MKKKENTIISQITKSRRLNNIYWMQLLKLAIKTSPKKAKLILKNINKQDKKISSLLSKLSKYWVYFMKKKHLVILGAGLPHSSKKNEIIDNFIKSVSSLNFIINFSKKDISRVSFVSGYKYKEIKINSKNLKVIKNKK